MNGDAIIPCTPMPCGHLDRLWNGKGEERCYECHGKPHERSRALLGRAIELRKTPQTRKKPSDIGDL